ncbi:MAG TPA: hypothetical protein VGM94_10410 [Galbitalea sp.]
MRFGRRDVAVGSALALVLFTGSLTVVASIYLGASAVYVTLSTPRSSWDDGAFASQFNGSDGVVVFGILLLAILCTLVVTSLALLVFGPIAGLVSIALRPVNAWPVHLVAYFVLGFVAAICVEVVSLSSTHDLWALLANPFTVALAMLAGASAAAGWIVAWRSSLKRKRAQAELIALRALVAADPSRLQFRDERF